MKVTVHAGDGMNLTALNQRLAAFPGVLRAITADISPKDARWRPESGAWSIVEIVAHLGDEERLDFAARVQLTLESPNTAWPEIDPEGWARKKKYRARSLPEEVERFCRLRGETLMWVLMLKAEARLGVKQPWDNVHEHPSLGPLRAGDVFAAWCAHDWLHLRQIAKRMYELTGRDAGGYSTAYAGRWGA